MAKEELGHRDSLELVPKIHQQYLLWDSGLHFCFNEYDPTRSQRWPIWSAWHSECSAVASFRGDPSSLHHLRLLLHLLQVEVALRHSYCKGWVDQPRQGREVSLKHSSQVDQTKDQQEESITFNKPHRNAPKDCDWEGEAYRAGKFHLID